MYRVKYKCKLIPTEITFWQYDKKKKRYDIANSMSATRAVVYQYNKYSVHIKIAEHCTIVGTITFFQAQLALKLMQSQNFPTAPCLKPCESCSPITSDLQITRLQCSVSCSFWRGKITK